MDLTSEHFHYCLCSPGGGPPQLKIATFWQTFLLVLLTLTHPHAPQVPAITQLILVCCCLETRWLLIASIKIKGFLYFQGPRLPSFTFLLILSVVCCAWSQLQHLCPLSNASLHVLCSRRHHSSPGVWGASCQMVPCRTHLFLIVSYSSSLLQPSQTRSSLSFIIYFFLCQLSTVFPICCCLL